MGGSCSRWCREVLGRRRGHLFSSPGRACLTQQRPPHALTGHRDEARWTAEVVWGGLWRVRPSVAGRERTSLPPLLQPLLCQAVHVHADWCLCWPITGHVSVPCVPTALTSR